jgi:hypothetical protein
MNDTRRKVNNKKVIYYDKIINVKQNIDPQIIKPDVQKEKIVFCNTKKEEHQKENVKNEDTLIPGGRLLATLKKERKDLIIKTKDNKNDKDTKIKDRADKLLKLKELLRELKEE